MSITRIVPPVTKSIANAGISRVNRTPAAPVPVPKKAEKPASSAVPNRGKSAQRPPCADSPDNWDMDTGNPESWHAAVRVCHSCPLITQCTNLVQEMRERGDCPRAMIWAGVAYDNSGAVIDNLDRHRVTPVDHKRPMRIIRNSSRPLRAGPTLSAPRRHIVLGRPLERSGSDL